MSSKVYIASPFFDEESKSWVDNMEKILGGTKTPYYSPRQDGIDFKSIKDPNVRQYAIKKIFDNNILHLSTSDRIVVNLNHYKGELDPGTLFELGYFVAQFVDVDFKTNIIIHCNEDLRPKIMTTCRNLSRTCPTIGPTIEKGNVVYYANDIGDIDMVSNLLNYSHLNFKPLRKDLSELKFYSNTFIVVDDHPYNAYILMGWMYAKGFPFYTCSLKGYGSNVMIAMSSKGHLQLPWIVSNEAMKVIN